MYVIIAPIQVQEGHKGAFLGLDHGVGHPSDSCPRWKHLTH
jgi:hypothetical protein